MDAKRKELYYSADDTKSYGGVERLYWREVEDQVFHITRNAVREFLSRQRAYTLHKPARRHFPRNRIYAGSIDKQWQADLADMVRLQRDNNGNRYILTIINVFFKFAWSVPVKNKDRKSIRDAFKLGLTSENPRKPEQLQTDKEKNFVTVSLRD